MDRLNESAIRQAITFPDPLYCHVVDSIDSTNRFLKESLPVEGIHLCCAETQTHGQGRFGRQWYSPRNENIYCSSRWPINTTPSRLSGLSLVVSLAVIETLHDIGLTSPLKIKWPNDILWNGKKLSGCLIEVVVKPSAQTSIIIGIGLNVHSKTADHPLPNKPWCSLKDITGQHHNRNAIIGSLMNHLHSTLEQFMSHGFAYFLQKWERFDALQGHRIQLTDLKESFCGMAIGVDLKGNLIVLDDERETRVVSSGEASITLQQD